MEEIGIVPTDAYASTSQSRGSSRTHEKEDVYHYYKKLQHQLEFLNTMEEYVVGVNLRNHADRAERRAAQPEARACACSRRSEADPVRAARDRPVPGAH